MKINWQKIHERLSGSLLILFSVAMVATLTYMYSQTEIRSRLENLLYDFRLKIIPQLSHESNIVIVTIGDSTIADLEGNDSQKLSVQAMAKIVDAVMASQAKSVAVLLPRHDFDYDSAEMWPLIKRANKTNKLYFGVFDLAHPFKSEMSQPLLVEFAGHSVFAADTFREYWRSVVRRNVLRSYLGNEERNHLATQVAIDTGDEAAKLRIDKLIKSSQIPQKYSSRSVLIDGEEQSLLPNFRINYRRDSAFLSVDAADLVEQGGDERLAGKIVLVGYTVLRIREGVYIEGTYINSPWQSESNKISSSSGLPLVYMQASALENLIRGTWFKPSPIWVNLFQTLLICLASFWIWRHFKTGAAVIYLALLSLIIVVQCAAMALMAVVIPLGDTVFASLISSTVGAFIHGQREAKMRTSRELRLEKERELSSIQSQFLNRFAGDLSLLNDKVYSLLTLFRPGLEGVKAISQAHRHALDSSRELKEYLDGMKQLASVANSHGLQVLLQAVSLEETINRLLNQFSEKTANKRLVINFEGVGDVTIWTDRWLFESILFNLLSNAIKYSPDGSVITVAVEIVSIGQVSISVIDQGPGIAPEFHEKVFEKFYRVKDDTVYRIKGTGLGLYLSRFFARRLGTDIRLDSAVGNGSTFSIICKLRGQRNRWWR